MSRAHFFDRNTSHFRRLFGRLFLFSQKGEPQWHPNVTKLAPSEKVKIGTRTAHSATEQRLCAVFLKKGMTRKRIEKSAKKSYSKRINYATL